MKKIITICICAVGLLAPMAFQPTASAHDEFRGDYAYRHHGDRVWIRGHHAWRHHHMVWIPGHYEWR